MRVLAGALMLTIASAVHAAPLTVRAGESWLFEVKNGQPSDAHQADPTAKPGKGQVKVAVRALLGTTLIATNNSAIAYSFNAELVPGRNVAAVRTCTLPAGGKPIVEQWDQKAQAVRVSNFRAVGNEGRC